jgi:hypothetical protein
LPLKLLIAAAIVATPSEAWPPGISTNCAKPGELTRLYPELAIQAVKNGQVILRCRTGADRRYVGCEVIDEQPLNLNFAKAALAIAKCDSPFAGAPGEVRIFPVHFRIPEPGKRAPSGGITVVAKGYWVNR